MIYYKNDLWDQIDSVITYCSEIKYNGPFHLYNINMIIHFKKGVIHNWDGPAVVKNCRKYYYIDGKKITSKDFKILKRTEKIMEIL